eukprot:4742467-Karenia_brevis.AAC.1
MAKIVPSKGVTVRFARDKCSDFIQESEKSWKGGTEGRTIEDGAQSSGSNGVVERAVKEIEVRVRTMSLGLEKRLGKDINCQGEDHRIYT